MTQKYGSSSRLNLDSERLLIVSYISAEDDYAPFDHIRSGCTRDVTNAVPAFYETPPFKKERKRKNTQTKEPKKRSFLTATPACAAPI